MIIKCAWSMVARTQNGKNLNINLKEQILGYCKSDLSETLPLCPHYASYLIPVYDYNYSASQGSMCFFFSCSSLNSYSSKDQAVCRVESTSHSEVINRN